MLGAEAAILSVSAGSTGMRRIAPGRSPCAGRFTTYFGGGHVTPGNVKSQGGTDLIRAYPVRWQTPVLELVSHRRQS